MCQGNSIPDFCVCVFLVRGTRLPTTLAATLMLRHDRLDEPGGLLGCGSHHVWCRQACWLKAYELPYSNDIVVGVKMLPIVRKRCSRRGSTPMSCRLWNPRHVSPEHHETGHRLLQGRVCPCRVVCRHDHVNAGRIPPRRSNQQWVDHWRYQWRALHGRFRVPELDEHQLLVKPDGMKFNGGAVRTILYAFVDSGASNIIRTFAVWHSSHFVLIPRCEGQWFDWNSVIGTSGVIVCRASRRWNGSVARKCCSNISYWQSSVGRACRPSSFGFGTL